MSHMLTKCHLIVRAISPGCNQVTLEHHSGTTNHSEGNEQWMLTYEQRLLEQSQALDRMNQMLKNLHPVHRLIFRLVVTSDLFETLPECRSLKSSIMTYNCNFKGNGYLEYFI